MVTAYPTDSPLAVSATGWVKVMANRAGAPVWRSSSPDCQGEALSDAEPVLSADVRLTRGRKRSERCLLLLHEELVVAKLRSQALKELTPEGRKGARVTHLTSIKLLERELSRRHAAHPKQGPATAPSANAGGLCPAPGEFGKARQPPAMLCSLVPSVAMQVGQPTEGCHLDGQGQLLGSACWICFCGDTEPLLLPAACRRAGRRLAQADPVARWLSRASKSTPPSHSRGSSCCLPAHPAAPHSTVLPAGQRRAGQALGPLAWGLHWWCLTLFSSAAGGSSSGSSTSRRRMGLPWPFALRRTPAAAQAPGQAGSSCSRALFGQPLAALCGEDNTLPRPIQELLAVLRQQGPATEGIFRRAAGGTELRQLREALDRGKDIDVGSQPALLLAVILKDFLRSIPTKLLVVDLYEDWMAAMERASKQAKVEELKAVADKLPAANLLLLKRLMALLQHIGHNAATSRMSCSNLAICVGPNLLSPPNEDLLPLQAMLAVTEKVVILEVREHLKALAEISRDFVFHFVLP
ncbi:uncharacterized protein LOC129737378 [Falco cherrug]|uniref:uncharacterized protein LOC129737378 n=2 Tax=Falco TaxID=8952 RepID=UPI00247AC74D|nr:uncharacterized protein LOC129737378 [Falco cherrug]